MDDNWSHIDTLSLEIITRSLKTRKSVLRNELLSKIEEEHPEDIKKFLMSLQISSFNKPDFQDKFISLTGLNKLIHTMDKHLIEYIDSKTLMNENYVDVRDELEMIKKLEIRIKNRLYNEKRYRNL